VGGGLSRTGLSLSQPASQCQSISPPVAATGRQPSGVACGGRSMAGLALGAFRICLGCETFNHGYHKLLPTPQEGVADFATMLRQPGPCEPTRAPTFTACHLPKSGHLGSTISRHIN
jgi:hypothetical protein